MANAVHIYSSAKKNIPFANVHFTANDPNAAFLQKHHACLYSSDHYNIRVIGFLSNAHLSCFSSFVSTMCP